jgi:hypothetical protein
MVETAQSGTNAIEEVRTAEGAKHCNTTRGDEIVDGEVVEIWSSSTSEIHEE